MDQRHSALARCLADLITTHTGVKAHMEQSIPGLTHTKQNGQIELARMDIVVALRGITYYIDTAIVSPFSANVGLMTAASSRPGHMVKREEKKKFDRYPPHQLGPIHPRVHRKTGISRTEVHQIPLRRRGKPTDSHQGRLGSHSNHPAQQHLQTTSPGGPHVTAMTTVSSKLPTSPTTFASMLMYAMNIFTSHITRNFSPHALVIFRSLLTGFFHFLFPFPRSVSVFRHDCAAPTTG